MLPQAFLVATRVGIRWEAELFLTRSVTIVVPCLRSAHLLPEAIDSVLVQGVAELELIVIDGGSSDGTLELLRGYGDRLRWVSEPDHGPSDALRKGFEMASAPVLGWLSADDLLLPGAIESALSEFEAHPEAVAVYGNATWLGPDGKRLRPYPVAPDAVAQLGSECAIAQPACFFRASAYREAGGIDSSLCSAFDYDLWIRLARRGPFSHVDREWALQRMLPSSISLAQRGQMFEESMRVLERHYGYVPFHWFYARLVWEGDGRDQFFEPLRPSAGAYLKSLAEGLKRNRGGRLRYLREWALRMRGGGFGRQLGRWSG
jgi:glycosyltransferase involved in cell wall biosynthesis